MSEDNSTEAFDIDQLDEDVNIADIRALLHESTDSATRLQAVELLGTLADSVSPGERRAIVDDLVGVVLDEQDTALRVAAIEALQVQEDETIDRLVEVTARRLGPDTSDAEIRDYFLPWLTAARSEFRIVGAAAMEAYGDPSVALELEEAFSDSDPRVRARAVTAYGSLDDGTRASVVDPLLRDNNGFVRRAAVRALGSIGSADAQDRLMSLTEADDRAIRRIALEHLGELDRPEAARALLRTVSEETGTVRVVAMDSLLQLLAAGETVTMSIVLNYFERRTAPEDRVTIAEMLQEMATGMADSVERQVLAAWLLGELCRETDHADVRRRLVQLLAADTPAVSELAAAYGRLLDGEGIERELQTLLQKRELSQQRRERAERVLERVKHNAATTIVEQSISYTYVRQPSDYTVQNSE